MKTIQAAGREIRIRNDLRPGDMGYVVYLHGILYPDWGHAFEGYVAESLAEFAHGYDAQKDGLWIAERDGRIVGSIGIVGRPAAEAQLRWFLVHPDCRGLGLGRALLQKALDFCRARGCTNVYLWTVSELEPAAHLYRSLGFRETERKTHPLWGRMRSEVRYDLAL